MQKQEIVDLQRELQLLEARLRAICLCANPQAHHVRTTACICSSADKILYYARRSAEEQASLAKAKTRRRVLGLLNRQAKNSIRTLGKFLLDAAAGSPIASLRVPPSSYVALSADPAVREQALLRLKDFKLDTAVRFIEAKSAHLDLHRPYSYLDRLDYQGDSYLQSFFVQQFEGLTLDDVFNALMEFHMAPQAMPDHLELVDEHAKSLALDTVRQRHTVFALQYAVKDDRLLGQ